MKRAKLPASLTVLGVILSVLSSIAVAQGQSSYRSQVQKAQTGGGAKVVSKTHQPAGKPGKVSAYAPHPTTRRAFGAPIQAPILRNVPPPGKPAPK